MKTITHNQFSPANDPLGLERFVAEESHHDLVASLSGYYTVVARMIKETDPVKAEEFKKRSYEVFCSERADIRKSYAEREIIIKTLSKEFKQLAAFAKEWKAKHKKPDNDPSDYKISREERNDIYNNTIFPYFFINQVPDSKPAFHFLAGQPGAGKTALREYIDKNCLTDNKPVVVNTDDLREFHPYYNELLESPDLSTVIAAPQLVNKDVSHWFTCVLNDAFSLQHSIILDTTLGGEKDSFSETIKRIHNYGWSLHLNVLAVRKEVSTLGVYLRFLKQIENKGCGRMVSIPDTHDVNYNNLAPNLTHILSLPQARYFNSFSVFKKSVSEQAGVMVNNGVEPIFSTDDNTVDIDQFTSITVDIERFNSIVKSEQTRDFTPVERKYCQRKIEETESLITQLRPELINDFKRDNEALLVMVNG